MAAPLFDKASEPPPESIGVKPSASIRLTITDNATSMLSVRRKKDGIFVRAHRMFLDAGDEVIAEIAGFIKDTKMPTPHVKNHIRAHTADIKKTMPPLSTIGRIFDLRPIFDRLNDEYFSGSIKSTITWSGGGGGGGRGRRVKKRRLGSYDHVLDLIRITPLLDTPGTAPCVVEFIVYHEMLHAHLGFRQKNGRRIAHTSEFKAMERGFRDYDRVVKSFRSRY
jgi:hypothetical protein